MPNSACYVAGLPAVVGLLTVVLAASGCAASQPVVLAVPEFAAELITGEAVFGEPVGIEESPDYEVLATTPEMVAFVADITDGRLAVMRFRRLLDRLRETGFFDNVYDASVTKTAADTFASKVGNCISYTNLFIALARLVDLDAHYQVVEVRHPTWNVDTGLLIRNNHINVVIEGPRFDRNRTSGYTIDFNLVDPEPDARVTKISDAFAMSLFYANLSVNELLDGNDRLAFSLLRRALELEPRNADLWINLGAFYSRHEKHAPAIASYEIAAQLAPREKIILSGMERGYRALGDLDKADKLAQKVRRHRQANPFYHFAVAQTAFEEKDYPASLSAINRAIDLQRRNPRFHFMKSLVEGQLGQVEASRRSLSKAKRLGRFDDLERRYGVGELTLRG